MFKNICYKYHRWNEWDNREEYIFSLEDTDFVTDVMISLADNGGRCGTYRDSFMTVVAKEYKRRVLNVSKNVALFYVWYFNEHLTPKQKITWNMEENLLIDANYADRLCPYYLYFNKNYKRCIINQIKIMQFCNKLPKFAHPIRRYNV